MRKFINLKNNNLISIELYRAKDEISLGLTLENDFENTIVFNVTLPFLFKFYISFNTNLCKTKWWKKFLMLDKEHEYSGREFKFAILPDEVAWGKDYYIHANFASYPWESGGGFSYFTTLCDLIYGDSKYKSNQLNEWDRTVFIPAAGHYEGGNYNLHITKKLCQWEWERFNKMYSAVYYEVECKEGVPHRIKWGQDYVYSSSFNASSVDEAIQKFINYIQESRTR